LKGRSFLNYPFHYKIDDTTTAILGGSNVDTQIVVFDWTTMTYTLEAVHFTGHRYASGCGLLKGKER
jgi:hypothetical protein